MVTVAIQLDIPKILVYLKNTNLDIINKMQANSKSEDKKIIMKQEY